MPSTLAEETAGVSLVLLGSLLSGSDRVGQEDNVGTSSG